ncbi:MAG: hypothetical protein AAF242_13220, partial [Bacteroidota bacterium]
MKTKMKSIVLSALVLLSFQTIYGQKQKKVQNFQVSHVINAPADKVWAIVGEDYGAIANSHPKIVSSD